LTLAIALEVAAVLVGLVAARDAGVVGDARPLHFVSRVDREKVRLGEPFTYELVITHPLDQRYELRPIHDPGPFEFLQQLRERVDGPQAATTTFKLKLSLFELGNKRLPDLGFEVIDPRAVQEFIAKGLEVEGLSSLGKGLDQREPALYDIKALEEVSVRTYRALWIALAAAALASAGYAIYRWAKRPRRAIAPQSVPQPLDLRTLGALDALRNEDLPRQGRFREFYFRLSEIIRAYLGERYRFEALECTSSELLASLRRLPTPGLSIAEISRFVDESDLVKFAKATADPNQCKESLEFAYRLVRETFSPSEPLTPTDARRDHLP